MNISFPSFPLVLLFATALVVVGCETEPDTEVGEDDIDTVASDTMIDQDQQAMGAQAEAMTTLEATEGNNASGNVTFTGTQQGVRVQADVSNLSEGMHGFHIHQNGDCSAPDASSAGGHYNPDDTPHGAPTDPPSEHHTGDMGNIMANASGTAQLDTTLAFLSLNGANSIVGKAVIVHQGQDDLTSQPSGAAGPRVACGVIEMQGAQGGNAMEDTVGTVPGATPESEDADM